MTVEETKQTKEVTEEQTQPTVEEPGTKSETEETASKTFTQDEVNALIADRLGREKKKYADYDDLKKKAEKFETLGSNTQEYDSLLTTLIEEKTQELPESFRELIPSNLGKKEQLEWVSKAVKANASNQKSETPVGQSTNPKPGQLKSIETLSPQQLFESGYGKK